MATEKEPYHFLFQGDGKPTGLFFDVDLKLPLERSRYVKDRRAYEELYAKGAECRYRLDGSTQYFSSALAPGRIRKASSDARVVIQLREPIARAWSAYTFSVSRGAEPLSFQHAIRAELSGARDSHFTDGYLGTSVYGRHVGRWIETFGDRLLITYYEDFVRDPHLVLNRILDFLDLPPFDTAPMVTRSNPTVVFKNPVLRVMRTGATNLRKHVAWVAHIPGAQRAYRRILAQGSRAPALSNEDRTFLAEHLKVAAKKAPLSRYLPDNPYPILG